MNNSSNNTNKYKNPWTWIPSLYFAEGLPYVVVMVLSVTMYKRLNISNTDIALYTSWLYLPWVIKPIWSPFVDILKTKRIWIVSMQLLMGAFFAGIAFTVPTDTFFQTTLAFFWLLAFSSATHDIAADGFYMLALDKHNQSFFIGIRSTFYRIAMITGQGVLIIIAGFFEKNISNYAVYWFPEHAALIAQNSINVAWSITFLFIAVLFIILFIYHRFALPRPNSDLVSTNNDSVSNLFKVFFNTFRQFFSKEQTLLMLLLLLTYRLGEAQLVKLAIPFMLDLRHVGGLGLSTSQTGLIYGTIGLIGLTIGGILGGIYAAKKGLKNSLWLMFLSINLPNVVYIYLSYFQPENLLIIGSVVAIEQFGYGFGFTAYMLYLIYVSQGQYKTAHYAIGTGFMALGMMLPGMWSGWLQESIGYQNFFTWVLISMLPSAFIITKIQISPTFGLKDNKDVLK